MADAKPGYEILTETAPDATSETGTSGEYTNDEIVEILETYRLEAEAARYSGPNSRDQTWLMNLDLYWNRFDFSKKAPWQAREVMPEVPQFVDRFAAAMRTALVGSEAFFTVTYNQDQENDLADVVKKVLAVQLRRIGRGPNGHPIDFLNVFEELMKLGALMMISCVVTPKADVNGPYIAIEPVDPYNTWYDPTGRNLYRIRRIEIDKNELERYKTLKDSSGEFLYSEKEIVRAQDEIIKSQATSINAMQRVEREKRTGLGQYVTSNREPVVVHEYRATLIDKTGKEIARNALCVVVNNKFLIRGPEKNPFWHGYDWLLSAPIIATPISPYGKSYVENFASLARTFNELTNLILDGVFTSAMKAFVAVPGLLEDPSQLDEGISPNTIFRAAEGANAPKDVIGEVDLGTLPPDAINIWQAIKKELQEGAAFNELTLGQLAPKGRTSATEVGTADQNANSFLKSIASNIETLFLEPLLDLVWKTTIQHLSADDEEIKDAVGEDWFNALIKSRRQFCKMRFTFVCRGISSLIIKAQKLQQLMQFLQIVGTNQIVAQQFMQEVSAEKLLNYLYDLMDIDKTRVIMSPREKQMQQLQAQAQQYLQMIQQTAGGASGGGQGSMTPNQPPPGQPQPPAGPGGGQSANISNGAPAQALRQTPQMAGGQQ